MLACVCQPADSGIFRKSPIPLTNPPLELSNHNNNNNNNHSKGAIPKPPGKTIRIPVITREPISKQSKRQITDNDDISSLLYRTKSTATTATIYVDKETSTNYVTKELINKKRLSKSPKHKNNNNNSNSNNNNSSNSKRNGGKLIEKIHIDIVGSGNNGGCNTNGPSNNSGSVCGGVELNGSLTPLDKINPIEREEIKDDPEACKRKEDDKELTRIPNEFEKV